MSEAALTPIGRASARIEAGRARAEFRIPQDLPPLGADEEIVFVARIPSLDLQRTSGPLAVPRTIVAASWSAPTAVPGQELTLTARTTGVPDGTAAKFTIRRRLPDEEERVVRELSSTVRGNVATARWTYELAPPEERHLEQRGLDPRLPHGRHDGPPEEVFDVEIGPERLRSGTLNERGFVHAKLEDETGAPIAGARYALYAADGSVRRGVTDAQGNVAEHGVPDGPYRLYFPDHGGLRANVEHPGVAPPGGAYRCERESRRRP
jgi:hypothetical protein